MLLRVRLGVQYTWLALACTLKMNKLHSYSNTNEGGNVLLNLKQRHVSAVSSNLGLFMKALDMDSGS